MVGEQQGRQGKGYTLGKHDGNERYSVLSFLLSKVMEDCFQTEQERRKDLLLAVL